MDGIYNSQFYPNLFTMLSAFIVLAAMVIMLTVIGAKKHKTRLAAALDVQILSPVPLTTALMVLGIGMGGFIDGIVLHQILTERQKHYYYCRRKTAVEKLLKS